MDHTNPYFLTSQQVQVLLDQERSKVQKIIFTVSVASDTQVIPFIRSIPQAKYSVACNLVDVAAILPFCIPSATRNDGDLAIVAGANFQIGDTIELIIFPL